MINIYQTQTMVTAMENIPPKPVFLKERYFPSCDEDVFVTEDVLIDYKDESQRKLAPCVVPRKGGILVGRTGYRTERLTPPYVAPERILTIDILNKRQFGETLFSRKKPAEREAAILRKDLTELSEMIDMREEYMASETLFENGYTLRQYADEYGGDKYEEYDIRFYEEDANPAVYTPSVSWDTNNDQFYQDLCLIVRQLKRRGLPVSDLLMGKNVALELMKNDYLLKLLDNRRVQIGKLEPKELPTGATSYGEIVAEGTVLELISYTLQYEDEQGKTQDLVPPDSIAVTAPNTGRMLYGSVSQIEETDNDWHTYTARRVPHVVTDVKNSIRTLTEKSRPLAVPRVKNSTISAKVLF